MSALSCRRTWSVEPSDHHVVFLFKLDAASQQQLGSIVATQQEVLKTLNELR